MQYDFDVVIDRRGSDSAKWNWFAPDVIPLWVADMDFRVPDPVLRVLHEKVEHGIFGYEMASTALLEAVCVRMKKLYDWTVLPEQVVTLPGLVTGIHVATRAICAPGESVLVQPPVYPPFLDVAKNMQVERQLAPLRDVHTGSTLHYEIDFEVFENAITNTTRLFILCNPHNPTGQVYSRDDLTRLSEICQRQGLIICSDEIHSELLLDTPRHTPIATLSPEIADRSITLIAPSKTFNLAGLFCSFAIIPNADLRQKFNQAMTGIVPHTNSLGLAAAHAAFTEGDEWLGQLLPYLKRNRDVMVDYVTEHLPGIATTVPEGTYLAWLDCREAIAQGLLPQSPQQFFLDQAKVGLNDGSAFGPGGEGFVRLNFGCPRVTLVEGLNRMSAAMKTSVKA
jgi:cystathionine beta-lyase